MKKFNARFQYIAITDLQIDPAYQRHLNQPRVKKLAREMDISKLGVLSVARRGSKGYFVVDGQHRLAALLLLGDACPVKSVPCWVYEVHSVAEEAALFSALNDSVKVQALDEFKAAVVSGKDAEASEINTVIKALGWTVGFSPDQVSCVKALRRVARMPHGKAAIKLALETCKEAYGTPPAGDIVEGVAKIYARFNGTVDRKRMTSILASRSGGQAKLRGDGRTAKEQYGGRVSDGVAEIVRLTYNRGLRTNKLPSLRTDA